MAVQRTGAGHRADRGEAITAQFWNSTDPAVTAEIPLHIPWGSRDHLIWGARRRRPVPFHRGTRGYDIDGLWLSNHIPGHGVVVLLMGHAETVAELWVIDTTTNTVQANVVSAQRPRLRHRHADSRWLEHVADCAQS